MRRPGENVSFDIWMPILSPSNVLLNNYHNGKYQWEKFKKIFINEVVNNQKKFLKFLVSISLKQKVTILCWEEKPNFCHRRLIIEACQKINPHLKTVLR